MIEITDKPTTWEDGDGWVRWHRRAAVYPNVLCSARKRGDVYEWGVQFGLPGVCVDMVTGEAPTADEARKVADDAAATMIRDTIGRMYEALRGMPSGARTAWIVGYEHTTEAEARAAAKEWQRVVEVPARSSNATGSATVTS